MAVGVKYTTISQTARLAPDPVCDGAPRRRLCTVVHHVSTRAHPSAPTCTSAHPCRQQGAERASEGLRRLARFMH